MSAPTTIVNRLRVTERRLRAARTAVDERTRERYELVLEARGKMTHREIAEALDMTLDGVFKLIERGKRTNA